MGLFLNRIREIDFSGYNPVILSENPVILSNNPVILSKMCILMKGSEK